MLCSPPLPATPRGDGGGGPDARFAYSQFISLPNSHFLTFPHKFILKYQKLFSTLSNPSPVENIPPWGEGRGGKDGGRGKGREEAVAVAAAEWAFAW